MTLMKCSVMTVTNMAGESVTWKLIAVPITKTG
jgi:hypothetical protein